MMPLFSASRLESPFLAASSPSPTEQLRAPALRPRQDIGAAPAPRCVTSSDTHAYTGSPPLFPPIFTCSALFKPTFSYPTVTVCTAAQQQEASPQLLAQRSLLGEGGALDRKAEETCKEPRRTHGASPAASEEAPCGEASPGHSRAGSRCCGAKRSLGGAAAPGTRRAEPPAEAPPLSGCSGPGERRRATGSALRQRPARALTAPGQREGPGAFGANRAPHGRAWGARHPPAPPSSAGGGSRAGNPSRREEFLAPVFASRPRSGATRCRGAPVPGRCTAASPARVPGTRLPPPPAAGPRSPAAPFAGHGARSKEELARSPGPPLHRPRREAAGLGGRRGCRPRLPLPCPPRPRSPRAAAAGGGGGGRGGPFRAGEAGLTPPPPAVGAGSERGRKEQKRKENALPFPPKIMRQQVRAVSAR